MKRLEYSEILVNNRLNGKKENATLLKRALLEHKGNDRCDHCNKSCDPAKLKVYRLFDDVLDNRPEKLTMLCSECLRGKPRANYWKPSRPGMSLDERASEQIMKHEDKEVFKILDNISENGF